MNRRGDSGDATMFFVFMFLMVIIAGGIWIGVYSFFGEGYDFKQAESELLFEQVRECLYGHEGVFDESFDIISECGFNDNVNDGHLIYMKNDEGVEFYVGVLDFRNQCEFEGAKENDKYPKCFERWVYIDGVRWDVIVGSVQDSRRVAV